MIYKIYIFFFSLSMLSCNCTKEVSNNENEIKSNKSSQKDFLVVEEVYYQKWVAGIKGGGSGINFHVILKKPLKNGVILEKVQFESYEGQLIKQSETEYVANIKTNLNDLVLDEDPKKEYGNKAPLINLKPKEANLFYQVSGKVAIKNLENVQEKQMMAYPSMKLQNNKE
ncbi:hypothetical protein FIA58_008505 [Flavobacterium jejuense]|uniref:Lipoprotein n=1 Tax=Flavobacterium jejuense TaxID=1544455 RepID=A0ABX0IPV0_9FLAO|nr:hypothetical protein [Flavobacterium jejuense]NHN25718.1 hypothetical protein [Flavobacterium jejuense]